MDTAGTEAKVKQEALDREVENVKREYGEKQKKKADKEKEKKAAEESKEKGDEQKKDADKDSSTKNNSKSDEKERDDKVCFLLFSYLFYTEANRSRSIPSRIKDKGKGPLHRMTPLGFSLCISMLPLRN